MTSLDLSSIRAQHRERLTGIGTGYCIACLELWPCPVTALLSSIEAAEARIEKLETALEQIAVPGDYGVTTPLGAHRNEFDSYCRFLRRYDADVARVALRRDG